MSDIPDKECLVRIVAQVPSVRHVGNALLVGFEDYVLNVRFRHHVHYAVTVPSAEYVPNLCIVRFGRIAEIVLICLDKNPNGRFRHNASFVRFGRFVRHAG